MFGAYHFNWRRARTAATPSRTNSHSRDPYAKLLDAGGPPLQARSQSAWWPSTRGMVGTLERVVQLTRQQAGHAGPPSSGDDPLLPDEDDPLAAFAHALAGMTR